MSDEATDRLRADIAAAFGVPKVWFSGMEREDPVVVKGFVGQIKDAIEEDLETARFALQAGGTGSWSEPHTGVLCLDGVEGMDGLIPLGDQRLVGHMVRQDPRYVLERKVPGALAILDLHRPNERGTGCVVCSRADESCGCVSAADDSWPCETVVALGAMFGVVYVPPPASEPQEVDLDALRAALAPDDDFGRYLLDFERFPELVVNGCPLTREMRIDAASMRWVWQKVMQDAVWDRLLHDFVESTPLPGQDPLVRTVVGDRFVLGKVQARLDPDVARMALAGIPLRPPPGSVDLVLVHDWAKDSATLKVTYKPGSSDQGAGSDPRRTNPAAQPTERVQVTKEACPSCGMTEPIRRLTDCAHGWHHRPRMYTEPSIPAS